MQSKRESLIETGVNIVVGFSINHVANLLVLPIFGFHVTGAQAFGIGLIFTVISIARTYGIRRLFNKYHSGGWVELYRNLRKEPA